MAVELATAHLVPPPVPQFHLCSVAERHFPLSWAREKVTESLACTSIHCNESAGRVRGEHDRDLQTLNARPAPHRQNQGQSGWDAKRRTEEALKVWKQKVRGGLEDKKNHHILGEIRETSRINHHRDKKK
ncbi:hypothetical protein FQA47_024398 [Oryzias melastigma]|uniref:Uncharacterized protein n=1 Tax=Oryzias melastigma TaxID=30732 RepID=A0A834FIW6_ORYME|nr:hypothetical protein FQA47_024398 [Oryzias melastigma]